MVRFSFEIFKNQKIACRDFVTLLCMEYQGDDKIALQILCKNGKNREGVENNEKWLIFENSS